MLIDQILTNPIEGSWPLAGGWPAQLESMKLHEMVVSPSPDDLRQPITRDQFKQLEPGMFVQLWWINSQGKWQGHTGVIDTVNSAAGTVVLYGAHEGTNGPGLESFDLLGRDTIVYASRELLRAN